MARYAVWVGVAGVLVTLLTGLARTKIVVAGGNYASPTWMLVVPGILGLIAVVWGVRIVTRQTIGRELGAAAIGLGAFVLVGAVAQTVIAVIGTSAASATM